MKKVLITDDDPRMVEIIKSAFEPFEDEFEVFTANNGQSALKKVREHHQVHHHLQYRLEDIIVQIQE